MKVFLKRVTSIGISSSGLFCVCMRNAGWFEYIVSTTNYKGRQVHPSNVRVISLCATLHELQNIFTYRGNATIMFARIIIWHARSHNKFSQIMFASSEEKGVKWAGASAIFIESKNNGKRSDRWN